LKAGEKGLDLKLLSDWGQVIEERVSSSGFGAEPEPVSPISVAGFVAVFDSAVKDEAAIRSADKTQDEISLGS